MAQARRVMIKKREREREKEGGKTRGEKKEIRRSEEIEGTREKEGSLTKRLQGN